MRMHNAIIYFHAYSHPDPSCSLPKSTHPSPFANPADSGVPAVGILSANAFPDLSRGKWGRKDTGLLPRACEVREAWRQGKATSTLLNVFIML